MQLPKRKPGMYSIPQFDPIISQKTYDQLTQKCKRLYLERPIVSKEMASAAEMGDFSENADYQQAKRRLRAINNAITKIEYQLDHCEIIDTNQDADTVSIGHTVTLLIDGKQRTYTILGASETNPSRGIISHQSPIGQILIGKKLGETCSVQLGGKEKDIQIVSIS